MKYIPYCITFICATVFWQAPLQAALDDSQTYTFTSQRQVGQIDHVNILLQTSGDVLTKADTSEKPDRVKVALTCRRDYDEKTLQLPTATEKTQRSVRYYHEASATLQKAEAVQNPMLGPDSRMVGVEIAGAKETLFSPKGPLNWDELDLVATVGESLSLDQLLPDKGMKIGESWKISDETMPLLLGLEEITSNSVQMVLNDGRPSMRGLS